MAQTVPAGIVERHAAVMHLAPWRLAGDEDACRGMQLQHGPWPQRQMRCANRALADPCQQASRRNFIVALHGAHCVPSVHEAGAINALNVLALCESVRSHLQNV
jgi:hypothetical protein